jgi:hypothetical protein
MSDREIDAPRISYCYTVTVSPEWCRQNGVDPNDVTITIEPVQQEVVHRDRTAGNRRRPPGRGLRDGRATVD